VQTAEASKRKRRPRDRGRPALSDDQRRKYGARAGLNEREYQALVRYMQAHNIDEPVAMRKIVLDTLQAGGFLHD
jgi:hypothetical protein